MTPERLDEIRKHVASWTAENELACMHSGCTDYACYCHYMLPEVLAEVERMREGLNEVKRIAAENDLKRLRDLAGDYLGED